MLPSYLIFYAAEYNGCVYLGFIIELP